MRLKHEGVSCFRHNGEVEGGWLVLDYFNVVLHLFLPEVRAFYQIEDLWKQATPLDKDPAATAAVVAETAPMDDGTEEAPKAARAGGAAKVPAKRKAASSRPSAKKVFEGVSERVKKGAGKRGT